MTVKGYIGIDFGTTNSHFAFSDISEGPTRSTPIHLEAAGKNRSTSTCVLWNWPARSDRDIVSYGDDAIEEWLLSDEDQRAKTRFAAGFKPELATSETARLDASAFLQKAFQEMKAKRTPPFIGESEGMPVVVGVPASVSEEHRSNTADVARKAGFGKVECLAEPLGALGYHLAHGQVAEEDVERGVLVVDFGGGTLDVAWLDREGVREPWGDPKLGGRLFDDLFFQWVTESSSTNLSDFSQGDLLYGWLVKSRELKEKFSAHWRRHENSGQLSFSDFTGRVECGVGQTLGVIRNASLEEFLERARAYRPSSVAIEYFKRVRNEQFLNLGEKEGVDLIKWIRTTIASGPRLVAGRDYSTIILTGGSSSWPFMPRLVGELFDVTADRILCANNPEQTVGEGLAIYNVLRWRHTLERGKIKSELPDLKTKIKEMVSAAATRSASIVADRILHEVMAVARKRYSHWRECGGALANVEVQVRQECRKIPMNDIANAQLTKLGDELHRQAQEVVNTWCQAHKVRLVEGDDAAEKQVLVIDCVNSALHMDVGDALGDGITTALSVVVGLIAGTLLGGGGTALLMSGPFGWILGAAIGAGAIFAGKDAIQKAFCEYNFKDDSLTVLSTVFRPTLLDMAMERSENTLRGAIQGEVSKKVNGFVPALEQHANAAANIALKKYGILEGLT